MEKTYTFIKDRNECGNIEACKFTGDVFITKDPEKAEKLRRSSTFGKTVHEIIENSSEEKAKDYSSMNYRELQAVAKEKGLTKIYGVSKADLISMIESN
jgi:hypothetical protein